MGSLGILTDEQLAERVKQSPPEIMERIKAGVPIDMHSAKMWIDLARRKELTSIVIDMREKDDFSYEMLVEISKEIDALLAVDYDADLPYSNEQFLEDLRNGK